jgi:hypothetical protein
VLNTEASSSSIIMNIHGHIGWIVKYFAVIGVINLSAADKMALGLAFGKFMEI